ncbi:hypothetical protein C8R46DRAFT_1035778 [Mycena filopes]|nr:hypothetical protein C8R46DRAFT_1035768 [Mycena filopes]KAJ7165174.1 hypothetical protein C8R46DRAFT_1035778 [Mycena filopes]
MGERRHGQSASVHAWKALGTATRAVRQEGLDPRKLSRVSNERRKQKGRRRPNKETVSRDFITTLSKRSSVDLVDIGFAAVAPLFKLANFFPGNFYAYSDLALVSSGLNFPALGLNSTQSEARRPTNGSPALRSPTNTIIQAIDDSHLQAGLKTSWFALSSNFPNRMTQREKLVRNVRLEGPSHVDHRKPESIPPPAQAEANEEESPSLAFSARRTRPEGHRHTSHKPCVAQKKRMAGSRASVYYSTSSSGVLTAEDAPRTSPPSTHRTSSPVCLLILSSVVLIGKDPSGTSSVYRAEEEEDDSAPSRLGRTTATEATEAMTTTDTPCSSTTARYLPHTTSTTANRNKSRKPPSRKSAQHGRRAASSSSHRRWAAGEWGASPAPWEMVSGTIATELPSIS